MCASSPKHRAQRQAEYHSLGTGCILIQVPKLLVLHATSSLPSSITLDHYSINTKRSLPRLSTNTIGVQILLQVNTQLFPHRCKVS